MTSRQTTPAVRPGTATAELIPSPAPAKPAPPLLGRVRRAYGSYPLHSSADREFLRVVGALPAEEGHDHDHDEERAAEAGDGAGDAHQLRRQPPRVRVGADVDA